MRPIPSELPPGFSSSPPVAGQLSGQRPVPTGSIGASWLWGTVCGVIAGVIAALLCAVSVMFSAVLGLSGSTPIMLICWGAALVGALVLAFCAGFCAGLLSKRISSGVLAGVLSGIPSGVLTALMSGVVMAFVLNVDPRGNLYPALATLGVIGVHAGIGALGGWAGRSFARAVA